MSRNVTEAGRRMIEKVLPGEGMTARAAHESLKGERRGLRGLLPFLGPAFVAAVAYVEPGNFATNISGGAQFGYILLWVVLVANLMAMLLQSMSAKLGIATGKNLPEVCRARFSRPVSVGLWIQAEIVAIATDLAEIVGAALGLNLLFGIPLFLSGLLAGAGAFGILELQRRGLRPLEAVITAMVGVIVLAFACQVFYAEPEASRVLGGSSYRASRAPRACCWPAASSGPRSCRTRSTCTRPLPSTG